ncbi:hypothetical protein BJY01DRAFT_88181 [Aspergillus pseudoustus]|uniref:RING-type domain-containing protein n=1 Tax=Aspergillus pseudoustus TaxID=1810923 RepID=A0ABR4KNQ5_9EURO
MSRHTPPTGAPSWGSGGTKATTQHDASGLFHTLQCHVDDIRALIQCGICIRPLYEPFTLACGHTFCYGCLTSWFAEGRSNNKTCPDCRAPVKSQPAPAYLVRAVVQLFTSRAELLDKGETTEQHKSHQLEEAEKLEADKKNTNPREAGLFRGIFNKSRHQPGVPIIDLEDGVVRCPHCSWELDESGCVNCGYRHDDDSMSGTDWRSDSEENSEMTDPYEEVDDEIEDGFGGAPGFDFDEWYDGPPMEAIPPHFFPGRLAGLGRNGFPILPGTVAMHDHLDYDSYDSVHDGDDDDEEDEEEDEDMDSFIDDGEPSEDYASDSDRSTVVGHDPHFGREQLQAILDESPSSGYSTAHSNVYDFTAIPDGESDESDSDSDSEDEDEDGHSIEDEDGFDYDEEEVVGGEDDEEDEEPIRPAVAGNRRRIPTYHILSSSSPLRSNGATPRNTGLNGANPHTARRREQAPSAGSTATSAIAVDDDDSDEGPVAPTRRARGQGNTRPSAL